MCTILSTPATPATAAAAAAAAAASPGLHFCTSALVQFLFCPFLLSSFSFSFQHGLTQQRRVSGEGCIRDRDVVSLSVLVRKTHLLRHLMLKMIILPRQARDKHSRETQKRDAFFRRLQMNGMKGSDSDILQSNVLDSYVDDHSSVSRAARLLFGIWSMRC